MPGNPTATDEKLAADIHELGKSLADFRVEVAGRFGGLDKSLEGIHTELRFIRFIGVFFAGVLVAVVIGAGRVIWDAATITAEVKEHGGRIEKVEKRLDGIDAKLDTLIRRTEPKTGG
jgi:hypothetical protein